MSLVKQIVGRLVLMASLAILVWPPATAARFPRPTPHPDGALVFQRGRLTTRDGWVMLTLDGSPYEMGVQQGVLLGARMRWLLQAVVIPSLLDADWDGRTLIQVARASFSTWPAWAQEEARGLAEGAGIAVHDVVLLNLWPFMVIDPPTLHADLARWAPPFRLDTRMAIAARALHEPLSAWPVRPLVQPSDIPLEGTLWAAGEAVNASQKWLAAGYLAAPPQAPYPLAVKRRPAAGQASMGVALPGWVGVLVGIQTSGMTVAWVPLPTLDRAAAGVPPTILAQAALTNARSPDQVPEAFLRAPRFIGGDLLAVGHDGALRLIFSGRTFHVETGTARVIAPTDLPATMPLATEVAAIEDATARRNWLDANAGFLTHDAYAATLIAMGGTHPDGWLAWYADPREGTLWLASQAGAFPAPASGFVSWSIRAWSNEEQ